MQDILDILLIPIIPYRYLFWKIGLYLALDIAMLTISLIACIMKETSTRYKEKVVIFAGGAKQIDLKSLEVILIVCG